MVVRPDAFICLKCNNRFNNEHKKVTRIEKDGFFISKTSCPKCHSTRVRTTTLTYRNEY